MRRRGHIAALIEHGGKHLTCPRDGVAPVIETEHWLSRAHNNRLMRQGDGAELLKRGISREEQSFFVTVFPPEHAGVLQIEQRTVEIACIRVSPEIARIGRHNAILRHHRTGVGIFTGMIAVRMHGDGVVQIAQSVTAEIPHHIVLGGETFKSGFTDRPFIPSQHFRLQFNEKGSGIVAARPDLPALLLFKKRHLIE